MDDDNDLVENAANVVDEEAHRSWERRCEECLRSLREDCKRRPTITGTVNSLVGRILRLEGARNELRDRFVRVGAGLVDGRGYFWSEIETAFERRLLTGAVINSRYVEPRRFLNDARETVLGKVRENLVRHACLKVNTVFNGKFVSNGKIYVKSISTKNQQLFLTTDLDEWYDKYVIETTLTALEEFQERDSGWALSRIINLIVNINKCNPMQAGCWIDIPKYVEDKRAVVNVRSTDNACFAWAVVAALYPVESRRDRCARYPDYRTVLKLDGIDFPVTLREIARFERLNDISVNVFTFKERNDKRIVPLRLTDSKRDVHINLLYLPDLRRGANEGHFAWIKNLSRLLGNQISKHKGTKYFCDRCLHYFSSRQKLSIHVPDCERMNDCAVFLPKGDAKWLYFKNYDRNERLPFVVYADLECVLEKQEEEEKDGESVSKNRFVYQRHRAFSVGYYVRCVRNVDASTYRSYRGRNCISWFVNELNALAHRAKETLHRVVLMAELTREETFSFREASRCHICGKSFESTDVRVRDHCHITGRYRGAAHSSCNLNYNNSYVIPVFFHNLSGYDAHFIIKEVANKFEGRVELLPLNKETYISFTKSVKSTIENKWNNCVKLRFVDSYKFLSAGLGKLVSYLDRSELRITRSIFSDLSDEDFDLLTRKGVFPYEYVDSVDRLLETELPPREAFYSSLTGESVCDDDYEHAVNVWQRFRVNTLGEYSDLYLKTDVLLLADVFENFRDNSIESYGLDPTHYYTLPGYTWDAMLKYTGVRFELLTDIDMVLFVERGVRGGLSQCSNRYAFANNRYLPSYDSSKTSSYLMYFDVNNLYGWAMCESLPYACFQWVNDAESFDVMSVTADSDIGYILEVDLAYPLELHDAHSDLPFCPIRAAPPGKRNDKLLATLHDKSHYVIHYRNLQQCVRHGMRLTRIHRVLQFAQSPWLRGYIELNTAFRSRAKNEFERNMYKLMNNAVFGKTMENVRDRVDVRLVTRWEGRHGVQALIARPNFHSRSVFAEDLVAVELRKLEVTLNKPLYVGMTILEIAKTRVFEFHYDYMSPLYRDRCKVMYTDTDSLIYFVECDDIYEDMKRSIDRFDTSDYSEDNPYDMPRVNGSVPGLMKDENRGAIMTEFVGLRAKMYATRVLGKEEDTKKIKGVKRNVVERTITFDDFTRCLRDETEQSRSQSCVRSRLHEVYTVSELRLALSPYDDKRYVVSDSFETLPWGHYRVLLIQ